MALDFLNNSMLVIFFNLFEKQTKSNFSALIIAWRDQLNICFEGQVNARSYIKLMEGVS